MSAKALPFKPLHPDVEGFCFCNQTAWCNSHVCPIVCLLLPVPPMCPFTLCVRVYKIIVRDWLIDQSRTLIRDRRSQFYFATHRCMVHVPILSYSFVFDEIFSCCQYWPAIHDVVCLCHPSSSCVAVLLPYVYVHTYANIHIYTEVYLRILKN